MLAAARLTLVATWDKISFNIRVKITKKSETSRFWTVVDNLLACVWCSGFHISWLLNIPTMFVLKWEYEWQAGKTLPWLVLTAVFVNTSLGISYVASKLASGVNDGVS